jgi:RimJ/RimL family protein N-acetyltransferase
VANSSDWGPVLTGQRVRLEPIDQRLATAIVAGAPDEGIAWEEGFPMPPLLGIAGKIESSPVTLGPFLAYVIIRLSDSKAIGDAGFHGDPTAEGELELGYAIVPGARRQGFAREAVELLMTWARTQPGVRAFTARVEPTNTASKRLLETVGLVSDGERDGWQHYRTVPAAASG